MKLIYLYVKQSPLGLKYLGITTKDPYNYPGSGKYWRSHLKYHTFKLADVETEILLKTEDITIISFWGLYYSKLWNIVESENWANLMPESGYKVTFTEEMRAKISKSLLNNTRTLKYKHTEETKKKLSIKRQGRKPMLGKKHSKETINKFMGRKGGGCKGLQMSKENRDKLTELLKIPIIQYDLNMNFIKEWDSAKSASDTLLLHATSIARCCKGKLNKTGNYKWKYKL